MQERVRDLEAQLAEARKVKGQREREERQACTQLGHAIDTAARDQRSKVARLSVYEKAQEALIAHLPDTRECRYGPITKREAARQQYRCSGDYWALKNGADCASAHLDRLESDRRGPYRRRTGPGKAWEDAEHAVKCAEQHVDSLVQLIADARKPPPPVYHAFPDTRKVAPQCMGLLFFLYPEATGTFPLLRLYCCAAQQCLVPLGAAGGPQSTPAAASSRGTESWVAFYNAGHARCSYIPQSQRIAQDEGPAQLRLFRTQAAPGPDQLGHKDVMMHVAPADGVWFPSGDMSLRLWQGGPVARYSCQTFIDPFAVQDAPAVARSLTEQGTHQDWLQVAAPLACSRLCARGGAPTEQPHWPGFGVFARVLAKRPAACGSGCCGRHSFQDSVGSVEAARGNRVMAEQGKRPEGMAVEQWKALAALRAYPLQQLRVLCVALREGHLQLESPQVCPTRRHVGTFRSTVAVSRDKRTIRSEPQMALRQSVMTAEPVGHDGFCVAADLLVRTM